MKTGKDVRPSPIAGQWYEANPQRLAAQVDRYINTAALPVLAGQVVAVMSPHAGHLYSGPVAGYAYAALRGTHPEVVAVISPMHYMTLDPLLTTAHAAYETPLGPVPVAQELVRKVSGLLQADLGFGLSPVRRDPEHSLEIQLPFLQRVLDGEFLLLPVMVRDQTARVTRALGHALAQALQGRQALLVASTDLSHFYPQATAAALDHEVLRQVEAFDPQGVLEVEEQGKGFACGRGALAAVLWAAKELGADHVQLLKHATSGDVTGDFTRVVGYGAAVITRAAQSEN
jgi:AmmeMemoRadiSam system protein B